MQKVIILKGLPGSGKSTWAREQIDKNPGKYKRINKDDLRSMLDNGKWSKKNEEFIVKTHDKLLYWAVQGGYDVIVDNTNLTPRHEQRVRDIVGEDVEVEIKLFDTPIEECIARDLTRHNSVGEKVIRDMHAKFVRTQPPVIQFDPNLPSAIICDIDGTLAKMNGRGPFEWGRVGEDLVNEPIAEMVTSMYEHGTKLILVSGRDGSCKPQTMNWLGNYGINYTELYMRATGNSEKDSIIKERIYNEYIKGRFNIKAVFDDRDQVVEMWRSLGLTCLQVDYGNF